MGGHYTHEVRTHEGQGYLSARQRDILQFIIDFRGERGIPPTVRDIQQRAEKTPISSTSVVDYNLKALEDHGLIRRDRGLSRSIELVEDRIAELVSKGTLHRRRSNHDRGNMLRLPLAATPIAAGTPIDVLDALQAGTATDTIEVDTRFLGRWADHVEDLFAVPVKGQSMIDALIDDGDIVIMARQATAHDREMVAVWLKEEQATTLKYFYHEGDDRVRLQPANTTMNPIFTTSDNVEIMG